MSRRAVLIYNPKSGRHVATRVLPAVVESLTSSGFDVEPQATQSAGDATRLAREAVAAASIEVAFAMGGDGTLREVARGLLGSDLSMGLLPAGTTNVLALSLGLPRTPLEAAKALPQCIDREIDVGLVGDEPFLMLVSAGLDAAVMARQNHAAKKRFGKAAVAWTGIHQWAAYDYSSIELRFDGRTDHVSHFAACNIPHYAGPFRMAPSADLADGLLDLVLFHGSGRFATLAFARDLALGRHLRRADVETRRIERLKIVAPEPCLLQIDGDVIQVEAPVEIRLAANRLKVLAPPNGE
ncbi:MAG: diacylglycerol kinase family protein [Acidobacteriota bacterium]